ncbi:MAG: flavin reductase family protein [Burkholderiales bacterium]|nr:flavin reductase family protein [Burkholderiales bacterium]
MIDERAFPVEASPRRIEPILHASGDARALRNALGRFATGVTVVTTIGDDGVACGVTASSFNSVSLDPPMVLWSQSNSAPSNRVFQRAAFYCVNVLGAHQRDLSDRFARPAANKFEGVDYALSEENLPMIGGAIARFICRNDYKCYGGDHTIFVGTVVRFGHLPDSEPLIFFGGRYRG